jgi:DNA-binding transcriptional MerR regulator
MRIDELAQRTGVSRRTLETYESRGLLYAGDAVNPDAAEESVERVHEIRRLIHNGYSLERIASELERDAAGARRLAMPDARAFPELLIEPSRDVALAAIEECYVMNRP